MSTTKLIPIALTLATLAASTGQLPWILRKVRVAQAHLIQDSQASTWGKLLLLPTTN